MNILRTINRSSNISQILRGFAKKVKGKGVAAVSKSRIKDVESDANLLVNNCCINYKIDELPINLKPDSEYPEWLWKLNTKPGKPDLASMDENSYEYWRNLRRNHYRYLNSLSELDGWHRKDHRSDSSITKRFYPEWSYILNNSC